MTPADAYRRCLWAKGTTPLGRAVDAIREWRDADGHPHAGKAKTYWRDELLIIVSRMHDPADLFAACLVAVEAGVTDAGTVWDAAPGRRV